MHAVLDTVRSFADTHSLLTQERIVVGLSGGADSLVLTDILGRLGHSVLAVHVNYRLRGEEADADEAFVRNWCEHRSIPVVVRAFDTREVAARSKKSVQETARDLRYEVFADVARYEGIGTVAVGHHRDDQAETVLLNLFRGAGPEGLAGMPVIRELAPGVRLVRPLLCLSREEIEEYAGARGLAWRIDATNVKPEYRRGALRSEILPLIEKHFGHAVIENIVRSSELLRAYVALSMSVEVEGAFNEALLEDGVLSVAVLSNFPKVIRGRVLLESLRRWLPDAASGFSAVKEVESLLSAQVGKRVEYGGGVVWRDRESIRFLSGRNAGASEEQVLEVGRPCILPQGLLNAEWLERVPDRLDAGGNVAHLDAAAVSSSLVVRPWKPADRFTPLGMSEGKKLSDFLTDARVPPHEKRNVHVVESGGRIAWVVGHRISDHFKVGPETKRILRLNLVAENTSRESE